MKYKKCPKCELNYILEDEDLCPVCKNYLKNVDNEEDIDETDNMCAVCGVRPAVAGGELCSFCINEQIKGEPRKSVDASGDYSDDDIIVQEPSMEEIGINIIDDDDGIADVEDELDDEEDSIDFKEEENEFEDELWDE